MSFFNFINKEEQLYLDSKENRNALTKEWKNKGAKNFGKLTAHEYYVLFNDLQALKRELEYFEIVVLSMCDKAEAEKLKAIHRKMTEDELIVSIRATAHKILNEINGND